MAEELRRTHRHPTRTRAIHAREILDAQGLPTVEVDVVIERAAEEVGASS